MLRIAATIAASTLVATPAVHAQNAGADLRDVSYVDNGTVDQRMDVSWTKAFGHSSGCHLAAVLGTNPDYLRTVRLPPSDIAGIILMGCTLDRDDAGIRKLSADAVRAGFMKDGQDVATFGTPENYLSANPSNFVGKHVPPALVIVAERERSCRRFLSKAHVSFEGSSSLSDLPTLSSSPAAT